MEGDAAFGCVVGLVDVDSLDGAAEVGAWTVVWSCAADGVVEYVDSGCSCAVYSGFCLVLFNLNDCL